MSILLTFHLLKGLGEIRGESRAGVGAVGESNLDLSQPRPLLYRMT